MLDKLFRSHKLSEIWITLPSCRLACAAYTCTYNVHTAAEFCIFSSAFASNLRAATLDSANTAKQVFTSQAMNESE